MTTAAALHAELTELLASTLNIAVPSADTDLIGSGLLDSIGMVELLVSLEQRYGITVNMRELAIEHFQSVTAIADYVASQRAETSRR